jgi:3-isopropylmalate dehydrogenase
MVVVREGTEGPYTGAGGVMRKGTPHEIATQESVNTAFGVERVVRYAFAGPGPAAQEAHAGAQDQRADLRRRPVAAHRRPLAKEFPEVDGGLPARRRGLDVLRHAAGAVRRDRHRQPVRRHPHRPRRGHRRRHRPGGQRQHQPGPGGAVHVRAGARQRAGHRGPVSKADPTAAILSAAMLCQHLGLPPSAKIEQAVADDLVERQGAWRPAPRWRSATTSPKRVSG